MTQDERRKLKNILVGVGGIVDIGARYAFLADALSANPDRRKILQLIVFGGDALTYTNNVLVFLERWEDGGEALAAFLNSVSEYVSENDAHFIRNLVDRNAVPDWKGVDDSKWQQEKIIGENTLEPFALLYHIIEVGRAVVWIESPGCDGANNLLPNRQYGTGFLVSPRLLLTNHHVICNPLAAAQSVIRFGYDRPSLSGGPDLTETKEMGLKPSGIFITAAERKHDCTLVELAAPVEDILPVKLSLAPVFVGSRVPIIQHPKGEEKQISQRNNFVAYTDDTELQYTTSTLPGSSGSPVFDPHYNVVGLHTSGGDIVEPNSGHTYYRNRGTRISAVLKALEAVDHEQFATIRTELRFTS